MAGMTMPATAEKVALDAACRFADDLQQVCHHLELEKAALFHEGRSLAERNQHLRHELGRLECRYQNFMLEFEANRQELLKAQAKLAKRKRGPKQRGKK